MPKPSHFQLDFEAVTDAGKRGANEDNSRSHVPTAEEEVPYGAMFVVADGIGSLGQGDVASATALEVLFQTYYDTSDKEQDTFERLKTSINAANLAVVEQAQQLNMVRIGTTLAGLVITPSMEVYTFNVGDSRVYRLRGNFLSQLTIDSSSSETRGGNVPLSEFIGQNRPVKPAFHYEQEFQTDDRFIICTDGLWKVVQPEEIFKLAGNRSAQATVERLLNVTLERGAPDNVTIIVLRAKLQRRPLIPILAATIATLVIIIIAALLLTSLLQSQNPVGSSDLTNVAVAPSNTAIAAVISVATHTPNAEQNLRASQAVNATRSIESTTVAQTTLDAAALHVRETLDAEQTRVAQATSMMMRTVVARRTLEAVTTRDAEISRLETETQVALITATEQAANIASTFAANSTETKSAQGLRQTETQTAADINATVTSAATGTQFALNRYETQTQTALNRQATLLAQATSTQLAVNVSLTASAFSTQTAEARDTEATHTAAAVNATATALAMGLRQTETQAAWTTATEQAQQTAQIAETSTAHWYLDLTATAPALSPTFTPTLSPSTEADHTPTAPTPRATPRPDRELDDTSDFSNLIEGQHVATLVVGAADSIASYSDAILPTRTIPAATEVVSTVTVTPTETIEPFTDADLLRYANDGGVRLERGALLHLQTGETESLLNRHIPAGAEVKIIGDRIYVMSLHTDIYPVIVSFDGRQVEGSLTQTALLNSIPVEPYGIVRSSGGRVHMEPRPMSETLRNLMIDDRLQIIGRRGTSPGWTHVVYEGDGAAETGWVQDVFITVYNADLIPMHDTDE